LIDDLAPRRISEDFAEYKVFSSFYLKKE